MPLLQPRRVAALALVALLAGAAVAVGAASWSEPTDATSGRARPAVVGIVDTGIDPDAEGLPLDREASVSLVADEPLADTDGHGTEMAWIVHGAAPSARIIAVKAVDEGGGTSDQQVADGIEHLRRSGATVVLLSLAGAEPLPKTREAIRAAGEDGVLVVAAAGNDGLDLGRTRSYPGGYRLPNLVTVAAVDEQGELLGSSNRGGPVAVEAPGSVATCDLDGEQVWSHGTSAAAALAAGTAARTGATARSLSRVIDAPDPAHDPSC